MPRLGRQHRQSVEHNICNSMSLDVVLFSYKMVSYTNSIELYRLYYTSTMTGWMTNRFVRVLIPMLWSFQSRGELLSCMYTTACGVLRGPGVAIGIRKWNNSLDANVRSMCYYAWIWALTYSRLTSTASVSKHQFLCIIDNPVFH